MYEVLDEKATVEAYAKNEVTAFDAAGQAMVAAVPDELKEAVEVYKNTQTVKVSDTAVEPIQVFEKISLPEGLGIDFPADGTPIYLNEAQAAEIRRWADAEPKTVVSVADQLALAPIAEAVTEANTEVPLDITGFTTPTEPAPLETPKEETKRTCGCCSCDPEEAPAVASGMLPEPVDEVVTPQESETSSELLTLNTVFSSITKRIEDKLASLEGKKLTEKVYEAVLLFGIMGATAGDVASLLNKDLGSITPRFRPLMRQRRLMKSPVKRAQWGQRQPRQVWLAVVPNTPFTW